MSPSLATIPPPAAPIYRVARRGYDPFSPPDWEYAHTDGTFGNRFDDPGVRRAPLPLQLRFRMIYCATEPVGAFGETLARVRPDLRWSFHDPQYVDESDDAEPMDLYLEGLIDPANPQSGLISADWRSRRVICSTELERSLVFVNLAAAETISHVRNALGPVAVQLGLEDIDFSSVTGPLRQFTQECARYIYEQRDDGGKPLYAGIRYLSRHTPDWECWAIFHDRMQHHPGPPATILPDNPALREAARIFNLTIESVGGQHIRPKR